MSWDWTESWGPAAMRLTDCRYDRDRLRLEIAYRLIGYEVRTESSALGMTVF